MRAHVEKTNLVRCSTSNATDTYRPSVSEPSIGTSLRVGGKPRPPANEETRQIGDRSPEATESTRVIDDEFVKTLSATADAVASRLDSDLPQPFQKRVDAWCERHGFDGLERSARHAVIARQAVLNLWLKATLYEWYRQRANLPPLDADARETLREAEDRTGNPAFGEHVLDGVAWLADGETIDSLIDERHRLRRSTQPAEDVGRLYEALTSNESRRPLGQFRTPREIGSLMRTWAADGGDTVLDPGMGAAGLTSPDHPRWELSTEPSHVNGIDRSPFSRLMGTTVLTLAGQSHDAHATDFLELTPDDISTEVDAIVCNPPYTRHQDIPTDYKDELRTRAERVTGSEIGATSPLYAYFSYHARRFLDSGDRAAFIIPQAFLAADYGESLKRFLLSRYRVRALLLFGPDAEPGFDEALTTRLIAFLEARDEGDETGVTRFIRADSNPGSRTLREAVRNGQHGTTDWGSVNCVRQGDLDPERNWQSLFDPIDVDTDHLTPFSELAEIKRGLSTGENDFFCLTQREVSSKAIEERYLSPLLRSPRNVRGYDFRLEDWDRERERDEDVWLLYHVNDVDGVPKAIPDGAADQCDPVPETDSASSVAQYLQIGLAEHETLSTRSIIRDRSPWYRVERRDPAPVLVPYMRRSGFRALLNETNARHLNNCHGIYPDETIDRTELKALLAYLNSAFVDEIVRRYERTYAGGLDKLEPGDLANLPVLDPRELRDEIVVDLAESFDTLRDAIREDVDEGEVTERIDGILRRII